MYKIEDIINKVHCADCLSFMKDIPNGSADLILCDLPYGLTACRWDTLIPLPLLWIEYKRVIKPAGVIVLTASQPFTSILVCSNPKDFKYAWVWDKSLPTGFQMCRIRPLKQHEDILIFCQEVGTYNPQKEPRTKPRKYNRGPARVGGETLNEVKHDGQDRVLTHYEPRSILRVQNADNARKQHPTQKPVALFDYLIRTYSNPGEVILDSCIGAGTTAVAAIQTGRRFIGIEIDPGYCEIARKRIAQAREQQDLFRKPEITVQEKLL